MEVEYKMVGEIGRGGDWCMARKMGRGLKEKAR